MRLWVPVVVVLAASLASASPLGDLEKLFHGLQQNDNDASCDGIRFAMHDLAVRVSADDLSSADLDLGGLDSEAQHVAAALAGDGTAAWLASDIRFVGDCGGDSPGCGKTIGSAHFAGVFEHGAGGWRPVAWNIAGTTGAANQAALVAHGKSLAAIPSQIDAGAEPAAKLFRTTIGDPKALAASVSARKDALLYGSDDGERYAGGALVKTKLVAWKLAFTIHDGVRAGLAGKSLAWVAANVDATSASHPKARPVPYRAFFVYEHAAGRWQLVQAQFSFASY